MNKYYPGKPVHIHIQSLINMIQESNWVITIKRGKGKLALFRGNREWVIPIYGPQDITHFHGFAFVFCSHKTAFLCFRFNIQYGGE